MLNDKYIPELFLIMKHDKQGEQQGLTTWDKTCTMKKTWQDELKKVVGIGDMEEDRHDENGAANGSKSKHPACIE